MADKKTILEEALLDIKNIQKALNANTKEILRSVAKEEIDSVVKESLQQEADYEEEDLTAPKGETELGGDADAATADTEVPSVGAEDSSIDDLGGVEGSEVAPEMGMEPEMGMDATALDEPMDMTAASDDDVIAIYKKLSGEDEIEIVGDEIHLNITEPGEYVVKANESPIGGGPESTEAPTGMPTDLVPAGVEGGEEAGADYEIEMGGDGESTEGGETADMTDLVPAGEDDEKGKEGEEEIEENLAQTRGAEKHAGKYTAASKNPKPLDEASKSKLVSETVKKYNAMLTESKKLKAENEEFRKALKEFRNKLVETVVFNSNLTYVTRLFMEHSTTKAEKQDIIKRFDEEVSNLKESKKLYKTIANDLGNRKPINEAIENKIIKEVTTGTSKQLNESTAYVDPSTKRIIDLMKRVENNNKF